MLDLFTFIWGREMTKSYLEFCLPSLLQPGNIPASKGLLHAYQFYATDEAKETITQSELYQKLTRKMEVNWLPLQKGEWETTSNFLHQMKISAKDKHYMLLVIPDMAVGNGSILNMARLCDGLHNPILWGFPRVNEGGWELCKSLFKEGKVVSNRELVSIAMEHIEQTTYRIEDKVTHWLVRHNVPTPCILPDDEIVKVFSSNPTKNSGYDHVLPYLMKEMGYPWYLVPHSDIYFQVERGRHFFYEKSAPWNLEKQQLSQKFFSRRQMVWQGARETAKHQRREGNTFKLDLFTNIWGKEMTETFLEVCLPSLLQPQNIPAAKELLHSYNFYASDEAKQMITQSGLYDQLAQEMEVNWSPLLKGEWETTSDTLYQMKLSAEEGHYMLIMAPDNIIGNGSILNMARLCDGLRNPILFGFPRINEKGFALAREYLKQGTISNKRLVTLSMRHIEQTTYHIEQVTTKHWIVQGNTWRVNHNVPTPCILPDDRLIEIFSTNPTKNSGFDHIMPYWMIELGYPYYIIRHSDELFLAERGRHLIIEGAGSDTAVWDSNRQNKGLDFFNEQEAIWQGL